MHLPAPRESGDLARAGGMAKGWGLVGLWCLWRGVGSGHCGHGVCAQEGNVLSLWEFKLIMSTV